MSRRQGIEVNGGTTPGLGVIRSDIEHHPQPRDPFAVDSTLVLEALRAEWGIPYAISYHEGLYLARRREGPPAVMSGETPDEITRELRRDWGEAP